jgi:hypothetical protein
VFLICDILARALQRPAEHHKALVDFLCRSGDLRKTAFVSFNYDILIDNALADAWRACDLDYGVEFTNFETEDDWRRPRPTRSVGLFKLHGSLNWLYCPTCTALTLTPKEKGVIRLIYSPHDCVCRCREYLVPIIIPPTFFKVMSNFHLQQVWRKTEKALIGARRVVFCGYSLPDADIHVRYLFKRIEVNRSPGDPLDVFVVNEHEHKQDAERWDEIDRYLRFFRDPRRVHVKKLSFEQFASTGWSALYDAHDVPARPPR